MKRYLRSLVFYIADVISLNIALLLAFFLRFDFGFENLPENFLRNLPILATTSVLVKIIIFTSFRLYKSLWRYAGIYEVFNVVIASAIANGMLSFLLFLQYHLTGYVYAPRSIFALTFMIDVFAIGGVRLLYRTYRRYVMGTPIDMDKIRRVLIIGSGDAGIIIAREMKGHPELHLKPIGFIDYEGSRIGYKINGIPVLGGEREIEEIAHKKQINEIIIALPKAKPAELNRIYAETAKTGCRIRILPSMTQIIDQSVVMQKVKDVDIEDLLGRDMVKLDNEGIESYLGGKVVLITGAGGSIGSELVRQIAYYNPNQIVLLDNYENNLHDLVLELKAKHLHIFIEPVIANIREDKRILDIFKSYKPDIVFHAAAHKHVPLMESHPEEAIKNNVLGTWNVAQASHIVASERFVLISSDKAVNPTNVMGATKRIAEMIVQAVNSISKTEFTAVRFGNVLGSAGSVIPIFKRQIENGGPVTVTHPDMTRYFMAIPEAAQLVIQAGAFAQGGEIFILDMGQPVKILDLAENMIRLSGFEPNEDISIEYIGLRPGEKLFEELLLSEEGIRRTANEKIYVAEPLFTDYDKLEKDICIIKNNLYGDHNQLDIKTLIKCLVPTYVESRND